MSRRKVEFCEGDAIEYVESASDVINSKGAIGDGPHWRLGKYLAPDKQFPGWHRVRGRMGERAFVPSRRLRAAKGGGR